jgi:hypothetical protein
MDRAWARREREAVREACVGCTKSGERQRGERFGALSASTNARRHGWVGKVVHDDQSCGAKLECRDLSVVRRHRFQ